MAKQTAVSRADIESDRFDRPANIEILKVSSRKFVTVQAVNDAISPWLTGDCKFEREAWEVSGDKSGRHFTLKFLGNMVANGRDVDSAMRLLKDSNGDFRKFLAKRADDSTEELRIDRDENGRSKAQRRMAACLLKTLKNLKPDLEESLHIRRDYRKARISVFCDRDGICTMCPKSDAIERVFFHWDYDSLETLHLDKDAILDAVMPMFQRPEDNIRWRV